jgi:hypothetical protein
MEVSEFSGLEYKAEAETVMTAITKKPRKKSSPTVKTTPGIRRKTPATGPAVMNSGREVPLFLTGAFM